MLYILIWKDHYKGYGYQNLLFLKMNSKQNHENQDWNQQVMGIKI